VENGDGNTSDTLGLTFGYKLTEQVQLMLRYSSSLNPSKQKKELDVDMLQVDFDFYW
jgi:hypothetical protein